MDGEEIHELLPRRRVTGLHTTVTTSHRTAEPTDLQAELIPRSNDQDSLESETPKTGSRARDHLANERTYLAWVRTGLALFGASIALLKWDDMSNVMAYLLAILGMIVMAISTKRYFHVMHLLEEGRFEPHSGGILFVVAMSSLLIAVAFILHENDHLFPSSRHGHSENYVHQTNTDRLQVG